MRAGIFLANWPWFTPEEQVELPVLADELGLDSGVSGPQVSEGWYGVPFARPVSRTREYVEIVRGRLAAHYRAGVDALVCVPCGPERPAIVRALAEACA